MDSVVAIDLTWRQWLFGKTQPIIDSNVRQPYKILASALKLLVAFLFWVA